MAYETLKLEREDGIAIITLNRPQVLNAMNPQMVDDLIAAFEEIRHDQSVRALIITGAGRAFCAGADFKALRVSNEDPKLFRENRRHHYAMRQGLADLPIATIAAINGHCVAGGLELATECDILLADDTTQIGDGHINYGVIPGGGSTQKLPRRVGIHKAKELLFTGKFLTGPEAERIGLVNAVAPHGKLLDMAKEWARLIMSKKASVVAADKYLVNKGMATDYAAGLEMEGQVIYASLFDPDRREGIRSFLERKKK
ncbi:MAG: enoyl-CoA hydratase/isomerase family protein [Chloroflexi bacterium]|nr:enoyl-CoA hydratase/isomerase family protein [Chloroflexota bacterium]